MPILGIIASSFRSAAGPQGAYDALATVTVPSGGTASISFTGIPTGYKHLQIRTIALSSGTYSQDDIVRFNSDSGANYSWHELVGNGGTANVYSGVSATYMPASILPDSTYPVAYVMDILDYQNTNKYKTTRSLWGVDRNGSGYVGLNSGSWRNTDVITTITISPNTGVWNQNSSFALYGVK